MNIESFVAKAKKIHGDDFDYSKFSYTGSKNKSLLICNKCGTEFLTTPSNHLIGHGCKKCHLLKISKNNAIAVLKNKYVNWIFDFTNYINSNSMIRFNCDKNHEGISSYRNLIRYNVCGDCNELNLLNNKKNKILKNNLDIIDYIDDNLIKCKCQKCGYEIENNLRNFSRKNFKCKYCLLLNESKLLKNGEVELVKINEFGNSQKIHLKCKNNHHYIQDRNNLLSNRGCNECRKERGTFSKEYIFNILSKIHGNTFTYDNSNYKSVNDKIKITCRKGHVFQQRVSNHLQGKGCPICRESIGERHISIYLENKKIEFIRQKKFPDCKYYNHLPFDFFIPFLNIAIEYDGIQHYKPVELFGGIEEFEKTKIKDNIKNEYCLEHNIKLIRISYEDDINSKLDVLFDNFQIISDYN